MKRFPLLPAAFFIAAWATSGCASAPAPTVVGGPESREAAPAPDPVAMDIEVETKLQKRIAQVEFKDAELGDFLEWMRLIAHLNVVVHWDTLEKAAGITPATKLSDIHLKDVTVETAFMTALGDGPSSTRVGFAPYEGYLLVSTREELTGQKYRKTVIYDISDITAPVGSYCNPDTGPVISRATLAVVDIPRIISRMVDKDSWQDPFGTGTIGTISEYGDLLIINQTWENHKKIAALLADIRRHKPTFE